MSAKPRKTCTCGRVCAVRVDGQLHRHRCTRFTFAGPERQTPRWGTCPICLGRYALRLDGQVRRHGCPETVQEARP